VQEEKSQYLYLCPTASSSFVILITLDATQYVEMGGVIKQAGQWPERVMESYHITAEQIYRNIKRSRIENKAG
jgi:hypothetical protein